MVAFTKLMDPGFCFFVVALLQALSRHVAMPLVHGHGAICIGHLPVIFYMNSVFALELLFSDAGSSVSFQIARLLGEGHVSFTDDMANLSLSGSVLHSSFHVNFLL